MALDTLVVKALADELRDLLAGGRIDKIHQPEKDEISVIIRTPKENYRLIISASPAHPRIHFSSSHKENPLTPPMFCMLLRKHISSGKIIKISQIDYERIIRFDIESYNELGDLCVKYLIVELMGRNSNIIFTDCDMRIIDAVRHVDFTQSSFRQILPGCQYVSPPKQEKIPILSPEIENVKIEFKKSGETPDKAIMDAVSGISPLTAREIVYKAIGSLSLVSGELSDEQKQKIVSVLSKGICGEFYPCMLIEDNGKIADFSLIEINQYENKIKSVGYNSVTSLLEEFYKKRDSAERMKQKSADLVKLLGTHLERLSRKLVIQQKTLKDAEKKEQYKIKGDLLTSNLYRVEPGASSVTLENYYEEGCPQIKISLKPELSPAKNAQRYYKLYNKAKTAEIEVNIQMKETRADIDYIKSTLSFVLDATSESELNEIRSELSEQGFLRRIAQKKKKPQSTSKPYHFVTSDGYDIYVGKNNTQNDYLTLKFANRGDLWFHTKAIHGSHTIMRLGEDNNPPPSAITEAAEIAAYYSQARASSKVPVDYTIIKNVKKPKGAKPGMVIYDSYNTIYVNPSRPDNEKQ